MATRGRQDPIADLQRDITRGEFRPAYLVFGKEGYLVQLYRRRIEEAVLAGGVGGAFNKTLLFGARAKPDDVIEATRTMPMLGGRRLVVVEGIDEGERKKQQGPLQQALVELIEAKIPSAVLVLTAAGVDRRCKLYKAIARHGLALECRPLWDRNLREWVDGEARALGKSIEPPAVRLLVDLVGNDLGKLHNELQKLAHYVGERPAIALSDAEEAVADLLLSTVFDLTDALGLGRLDASLLALRKLHESKTAEAKTLWFVTDHFRKLLLAREAVDEGTEPERACLAAGMRKPTIWKVKRQLPVRTTEQLRRAMVQIACTDDALRRSRVPAHLMLDRLAMDLCEGVRGRGTGAPPGRPRY